MEDKPRLFGACSVDCGRSQGFYFSSEGSCGGFGPGYPIHQIHQTVVVDSAVLCQTDLTGAAGGNPFAALLHRILERSQ